MNDRLSKILIGFCTFLVVAVAVQTYYLLQLNEQLRSSGPALASSQEEPASELRATTRDEPKTANDATDSEAEGDAPHPLDLRPPSFDEWPAWPSQRGRSVFSEMAEIQDRMDRMFGDAFGLHTDFHSLFDDAAFSPQADITEREAEVEVRVDIPGVEYDNLTIEYANGVLTIEGRRDQQLDEQDENGQFYRRERRFGQFSRSIPLPGRLDPASLESQYEDGVLTVTLKRTKQQV